MKKKRGFHFFEAGLLLYLNFNLQAIEFYGILLIKRKKLQKELFSQIISVLLLCHSEFYLFFCNTNINEISDVAKS